MALQLGSSTPSKLYLGSTEVTKAYFGASEVYSSSWTPTQLSGLALWLDADDADTITLNGSTVSQWDDKSGNGNNASQTTAANQPTYKVTDSVLNGKPSIGAPSFDGTVGLIDPSFAAREFFFVTAYGDGTTDLFSGGQAYSTLISGPGEFGEKRAGMGQVGSNSWFESVGSIWAPGSYVNGSTTLSTQALPMPCSIQRFLGLTTENQTWGIGFNQITAGRSWAGPIGEVIALSSAATTTDRQKLEGYLAWKWGLEANLPADHPYKSTPPTA